MSFEYTLNDLVDKELLSLSLAGVELDIYRLELCLKYRSDKKFKKLVDNLRKKFEKLDRMCEQG